MLHLSDLRSLDLQTEYHHLTLAANCQLPRSLTALTIPNVSYGDEGCGEDGGSCSSSSSSACVLLPLTRLQQLALEECSLTADAIVQISSALTALTEVQLAYTAAACGAFGLGGDELVEAAAAWALLPLVSLSFGLQCVPSTSSHSGSNVDHVSHIDGGDDSLRELHVGDACASGWEDGAVLSGLMLEQLGQLTGLTSLRIYAFGEPADALDEPAAVSKSQQPVYDAAALAACLQQLPVLQSLHVAGQLVGSQQAVEQLQQAARGLSSCGLPVKL
jgi:hypothetical protein